MSDWRKGCLCGCLTEDECRYTEPEPLVVHHYHHVIYERPTEHVDAEVSIVREIGEGCP